MSDLNLMKSTPALNPCCRTRDCDHNLSVRPCGRRWEGGEDRCNVVNKIDACTSPDIFHLTNCENASETNYQRTYVLFAALVPVCLVCAPTEDWIEGKRLTHRWAIGMLLCAVIHIRNVDSFVSSFAYYPHHRLEKKNLDEKYVVFSIFGNEI